MSYTTEKINSQSLVYQPSSRNRSQIQNPIVCIGRVVLLNRRQQNPSQNWGDKGSDHQPAALLDLVRDDVDEEVVAGSAELEADVEELGGLEKGEECFGGRCGGERESGRGRKSQSIALCASSGRSVLRMFCPPSAQSISANANPRKI